MRDEDLLSVRLIHSDGLVLLELRGEIDCVTAPLLRESVERACDLGLPVVLDMDLVTFVDSSGISVLIASSGISSGLPRSVQIQRPSEQVRRVLSLTGLDEKFLLEPHHHSPDLNDDEHVEPAR